jgi:hypothetical protein
MTVYNANAWKIESGPMPRIGRLSSDISICLEALTLKNHVVLTIDSIKNHRGGQVGTETLRITVYNNAARLGFKVKTRTKNGLMYVEKLG